MNGVIDHESDDSPLYVEVDPTGRYGRYNEILGKGGSKIVYKGFDEYEGIEIAWNQVKLTDFLQRPEDLERLYSEIHLLRTMKHKNIIKFYASWVDTGKRNINFVTEMFTSGTLRQYRLKHKKVNMRAVKHWCRQILEGLVYLHSCEPPVIHRDLKCDNIFINGNQGEVKIGDLGLAAILRKSHAAHCVGTPEFMAPEVYSEEYNELVDIYSFGMCVLEMVTFEYPYSECTHPAQIYKKVTTGKKPDALYKVNDPEVRIFVDKCLASVSERLSARELLQDPFLQTDDIANETMMTSEDEDFDTMDDQNNSHEFEYQESAANEIELFTSTEDDDFVNSDITINGKRKEDGDIFLRLRIKDKEERIRNIYFPFDTEIDTALSVAAEMVAELEIDEQDVTRIADMIDGEIASLVPDWKRGVSVEEASECTNENPEANQTLESCLGLGLTELDEISEENQTDHLESFLDHSVGNSNVGSLTPNRLNLEKNLFRRASLADYLKLEERFHSNRIRRCSSHGSSMRGRFEEITYPLEALDDNHGTDYNFAHHFRRPSLRFHGLSELDLDETSEKDERHNVYDVAPPTPWHSPASSVVDETEYENNLKATHQLQLTEVNNQNLTATLKPPLLPSKKNCKEVKRDKKLLLISKERGLDVNDLKNALKKHFASELPSNFGEENSEEKRSQKHRSECCSPENVGKDTKKFYSGTLLPHSLQRTTSLPVDAVDC